MSPCGIYILQNILGRRILQIVRFGGNTSEIAELEQIPIPLDDFFQFLLTTKLLKYKNAHFLPQLSKDLCNICGVK